jgi:hypothetical protein
MRAISVFFVPLFFVATFGCTKNPPARIAIPLVPQPSATPAPPPPVIVDQTVADLPAPQPIPPDSMPPRPAVEYHSPEPVPAVVAPAPARPKTRPQTPSTPREAPPEPAAATPPPVEEPAITLAPAPQTLHSAEDRSTSRAEIGTILDEVRKLLSQVEAQQPKTSTTTASVNRINSLVHLAEQANTKNELRQAESLAKRALALARDLTRPR